MRLILAALLLIGGIGLAQAQRIEGIDILAAGIFKPGKLKTIHDPSISTGERHEATAELTEETTTIPARTDTSFGVRILIRGRPRDEIVPVRVVWRYPEPGLRNPDTGVTKRVDDYLDRKALGREKPNFYWILGEEGLGAGAGAVDEIEIYDHDHLMARQSFTLVKAIGNGPKRHRHGAAA